MFVFNISFQIAPQLQEQWVLWMKSKFIPMLMETSCFETHHLYELDLSDDQAPTFTLQLFTKNPENLSNFSNTFSKPLLDEVQNTWGDQCFHFVSSMRIVN